MMLLVTFVVIGFLSGCSRGGSASTNPQSAGTFTVTLDTETPLLTTAQRSSFGFAYGPPDGTFGALPTSTGNYEFFMSANSASTCTGTPSTEGTYRLGGTLTSLTNSYGCTASMSRSAPDPNGYTFDRNYSGGGPVLMIFQGSQTAIIHVYHGEYQSGTCKTGTCFYSSLGMALSTDGGATFSKLGEIIQPYETRDSILNAPADFDVGGGTAILTDANENYVANPGSADPSTLYLNVFYSDIDPTAPTPCNANSGCFGVARAKLSDLITAAFSHNTAAFPTLFKKFYNGAFTEPGTSGDANAAINSGHFTPVMLTSGSLPSVVYDTSTKQWIMAFCQQNDSLHLRNTGTLTNWPTEDAVGGSFSNAPNGEIYPTLLGESGNPNVSNGNPYLVYVKATVPWPSWPDSTVMERVVHLSLQ